MSLASVTSIDQALYCAAAGTVLSVLVGDSEGSITGIGTALLSVGGPTALGALVANKMIPVSKGQTKQLTNYVERGLIAGVVATGVLMGAGALPVTFDIQTLAFVGLVGVSCAIGDVFAIAGIF